MDTGCILELAKRKGVKFLDVCDLIEKSGELKSAPLSSKITGVAENEI